MQIKMFNFFAFFRARIRRNSEYTLKVQPQPAVLSASKSDRCLQKDGVSCYEYLFVFMNTEYILFINTCQCVFSVIVLRKRIM